MKLLEPADVAQTPELVVHRGAHRAVARAGCPMARRRLHQAGRPAEGAGQAVRVGHRTRRARSAAPSERHLDLKAGGAVAILPQRRKGRGGEDAERQRAQQRAGRRREPAGGCITGPSPGGEEAPMRAR